MPKLCRGREVAHLPASRIMIRPRTTCHRGASATIHSPNSPRATIARTVAQPLAMKPAPI